MRVPRGDSCPSGNLTEWSLVSFSSLLEFRKERPYVLEQQIGLLESGEVPAPRHFCPLGDVVGMVDPRIRRGHFLLEIGVPLSLEPKRTVSSGSAEWVGASGHNTIEAIVIT